jgi:poly(3-hydroxybutyrate) depolymerase
MAFIASSRKLDRTSGFNYPNALATCLLVFLLVRGMRAQDTTEKVDVNDVTRNYVVHLPKGYDQQQHYPVVILLHGRNQDADDMARLTLFNQLADKDGIIAVYPSSSHGQWNIGVRPEAEPEMAPRRRGYGRPGGGYPGGGYPGGGYPGGGYPGGGGGNYPQGGQNPNGQDPNSQDPNGQNPHSQDPSQNRDRQEPPDDVAFFNQILDQLPLKYSVDPHRIYATGLEDGGFMALRVGCTMSDRVAAVAAVGADMPRTMICLPSRAMPALLIDGTDDPIVPYNGGSYKPGRFHVLSAEDSAKTWAKYDRCGEKPAQGKIPAPQKSEKETKTYTYSGCQDNAEVILYSVKGGGDTWPGGEQYMPEKEIGKTSDAIHANEVIWTFFNSKKIAGDSNSAR